MTTEIVKEIMCIKIRDGIEVWVEKEKIEKFIDDLITGKIGRFVKIENQLLNTADIVGIFDANAMEDSTRRKNGQWKDKKGSWHDKGERVCPGCGNVLPYGMQCGNCR